MTAPSVLWRFAHQALSQQFHADPRRFVTTLDGNAAPTYLESMWKWALDSLAQTTPPRPPLTYSVDRPRPGLVIVWMSFTNVSATGEPWHIQFIVRDPDEGATNGYTRMFLLEHSAYASELAGRPQAIVCESCANGRHANFSVTLAPDDVDGFYKVVVETIRSQAGPSAQYVPPK